MLGEVRRWQGRPPRRSQGWRPIRRLTAIRRKRRSRQGDRTASRRPQPSRRRAGHRSGPGASRRCTMPSSTPTKGRGRARCFVVQKGLTSPRLRSLRRHTRSTKVRPCRRKAPARPGRQQPDMRHQTGQPPGTRLRHGRQVQTLIQYRQPVELALPAPIATAAKPDHPRRSIPSPRCSRTGNSASPANAKRNAAKSVVASCVVTPSRIVTNQPAQIETAPIAQAPPMTNCLASERLGLIVQRDRCCPSCGKQKEAMVHGYDRSTTDVATLAIESTIAAAGASPINRRTIQPARSWVARQPPPVAMLP
jgi:hypothetical protein